MSANQDEPVVLITSETEVEADLIVHALAGRGIEARSAGGLTSGFRAEAPGRVQILVRRTDLAEAREILESLNDSSSSTD